jgi:transposase
MVDTNFDTKVERQRGEVTGIVRRRHWSDDKKGRIVSEAIAPDAVIADVARRHDLTPQHLSNWIRAAKNGDFVLPACAKPELRFGGGGPADVSFVPAVVEATEAQPANTSRRRKDRLSAACLEPGVIEVAIDGVRVRVGRGAEAKTITAVIRALKAGA